MFLRGNPSMNYVFVIINNILFTFVGVGAVCFNQRVAGLSCIGQHILEVYIYLFITEIYVIHINRTHALRQVPSIHSPTIYL